jgi:uncharacterized repeat protein (TIGR01451 family)
VRAAALSGTGNLLANGQNGFGPNTAGNCTDAAGGAGAGGTLYAAVGAGLGGRTLQSNGGMGATSSYSQHGPGGGGGGGAVYFNNVGGNPTITAIGGANGLDTPTVSAISPWFATTGTVSLLTASVAAVTTSCSTSLEVSKTDGTTSIAAGSTATYTVTFTNSGNTAADGSVVKDAPSAGLSCSVLSCAASLTPIAGSCPLSAQWPDLLTGGGLTLPTFPAKSTLTFVVQCQVIATGL